MGKLGRNDGGVKVNCSDGIKEEQVEECKDVFIVVRAIVLVEMVQEGISMVRGARFVKKSDVVVAEGKNIASEVIINLLWALIVLEVLVINEGIYHEFSTKEKVVPVF